MKRLAWILVSVLLAGCAVYTRQGLYETTPVDGWLFFHGEGTFSFISPAHKRGGYGVLFSTPKKDELYLHVYFPSARVAFDDQRLRIIPHDGGAPRIVSLSVDSIVPVPGTLDFTLELPRFSVDGEKMPPFAARFKWSDRTYRIIRVAQ